MADDLSKLWGNLSISEEQSVEVEVQDQELEEIVVRGHSSLVGRLMADRFVSKEIIRSTLIRGWRPMGTLSFKVLGTNLFLLEFEHSWDKSKVLEGRHWVFERSLFLVEEFDGITPPSKIVLEKASFWVRMFNLPSTCMGTAVGSKIGASMGEVEEVETDEVEVGWGEFLRVRIKMDLAKPLARGRVLKLKGKSHWVTFQYERILKFCFDCGVIRHGSVGCRKINGDRGKDEYGLWLQVPSPGRQRDWGRGRYGGQYAQHSHMEEESSMQGMNSGSFEMERNMVRGGSGRVADTQMVEERQGVNQERQDTKNQGRQELTVSPSDKQGINLPPQLAPRLDEKMMDMESGTGSLTGVHIPKITVLQFTEDSVESNYEDLHVSPLVGE